MAEALQQWLTEFVHEHAGAAGTVHLFENGGLKLAAAVNIPPAVRQAVEWVPNGKGMAGLALQRKEPVQTCNLQEDRSGAVKPGAKAVDAQAAIALPILNAKGDVRAVVGIAFHDERQFTPADIQALTDSASKLPHVAESGP
jgi:L-methionine (R)-S-oxide reductase